MNVKVGDKVKFLNEKGQGIITKIINKTTVGVTIEDGFEIPYTIANLVVETEKSEGEKNTIIQPLSLVVKPVHHIEQKPTHPASHTKIEEEEGIYLAFSPEKAKDISHSDINVWLVNHTSYTILFTYSIWNNGNYMTLETGEIAGLNVDLMQTIHRNELNDHRNFKIDVLFFNEKLHDHQHPVSNVIKLKPIKLYKENAFQENGFISDKALIFPVYKLNEGSPDSEAYMITEKKLSKILFQKSKVVDRPKTSKPHANNNPANEMEIDLHIEELLDDYSNMSNAEIIHVQLTYFQNALDKAINEHFKKLIVIHGVGNGRLKQEVRALIAASTALKYYDASYARYGFGATEIVFF
jgi:hypothetical protein